MIKLNNKNITYVALADSNNSLKAPKEIWYADSNNSVKLVYRRKDALIEGEDYEKYHWLKTTGYAYINTKIKGNQNSNIEVIAIQYTQPTSLSLTFYGSIPSDVNSAISFNVGIASLSYKNSRFGNRLLPLRDFDLNQEYDVIQNKDALIVNGSTLSNVQATNNFESGEIYVFTSNVNGAATSYLDKELSIRKFVINNYINLIPCKLLKPVPKWLDANGIRRQVGECGMIDLVSGKFYGNVNNVGTFTVENYYERKEWLVGDGSAYIDTNVTSFSGVICIGFKISATNRARLFGRERRNTSVADYSDRCVLQYSPNGRYVNIYGVNNVGLNSDIENEVLIDITNDTAYGIDGATASGFSITPNLDALSLYLFADHRNYGASDISSDYISKFSITNSINLIPCTLTMDLPASMDANNIARTKGTSGMWDLVSDKFYGNVANSGTFKAVNLAEGVDYEVHDWLVGDRTAYMFIGEYSDRVKFKVKLTVPSNSFGFVYGHNGALRTSRSSNVFTTVIPENRISNVQLPSTKEILMDFSEHLVYADDVQMAYTNKGSETDGNDESAFKKAYFWGTESLSSFRSDCSIGTIYADNQVFIPVKLLKAIPSKYDANGITRQAGECGMYDTVNDVFYGNVASSGSFTVSDDN